MGSDHCDQHVEILRNSLRQYHTLVSDATDEKNEISARMKRLMNLRSDLLPQSGDVVLAYSRNILELHNQLVDEYLVIKRSINIFDAIRKKIVHEYFENHLKGMVLSPKLMDYASLYDYDIVGKTFEPEPVSCSPNTVRLFDEEMPRWLIREIYGMGREKNLDSMHDSLVNSIFVKNAEKKYHSEYFKFMREHNLMRKKNKRTSENHSNNEAAIKMRKTN